MVQKVKSTSMERGSMTSHSNELVTVDSILEYLQKQVESREQIPPSRWLDAAQRLNVLLGDEIDKLAEMKQKVALMKVTHYETQTKPSVAMSKMYVETKDEYRDMIKQEGKIDQINEFIRIAKLQARMKDNEFRNQNL